MRAGVLLILFLSGCASASKGYPVTSEASYRVRFKYRLEGREESGNFSVLDASQTDYVLGGDEPFEASRSGGGKSVEFKKFGAIINVLVCSVPGKPEKVYVQVQAEVTGAVESAVKTFQVQTEFMADKDRDVVFADGPGRRMELRVSNFMPGIPVETASPQEPLRVPRLDGALAGIGATSPAASRAEIRAPKPTMPLDPYHDVNPQVLKISFKIRSGDLEDEGSYLVESATQGNYVTGGDLEVPVLDAAGRKSIAKKKFGTIVNSLAVTNPNNPELFGVQTQVELSGPDKLKAGALERAIRTFQYQTEFHGAKGRTVALVDEPGRRVELRVEDFKP